MDKITDKKTVRKYSILFMMMYMISYITRINYGAVIVETALDTEISKSLLSLALTGSFVGYGTGQIISGKLGDKFQPKNLIFFGLLITSLMNLIMPVFISPYIMLIIWTVNGISQSLMWPPLVRLMATIFTQDDYSSACVLTSWGSSAGTIFVYLISPLLISLWGWKSVFFISALLGIAMAFIWKKYCCTIDTSKKNENTNVKNDISTSKLFLTPVMIAVMVAIVLMGMLKDGVTTWMPSYISEIYNLSSEISILSNVALPIFSIICFQITSLIYRRIIKNPLACAGVVFATGFASTVIMSLTNGKNAIISTVSAAVLTGSMHGVNLILISMLPSYFYKYGNISAVSGVLNSCTYIGSAISTYGIALISENFGWAFTLLIWCIIAGFGTLICFLTKKPWERFIK